MTAFLIDVLSVDLAYNRRKRSVKMNETLQYGAEILVGFVVTPWVVWVTVSIFTMKQEQAVMKAISAYIQSQSKGNPV